jgi:large subunit ribosomal protein L25
MRDIALKAQSRKTGRTAVKAVRKAGLVPGVVYAGGKEAIPFAVEKLALRPVVYTSESHVVALTIDGQDTVNCILKDITFDPITDAIVHLDFYQVQADQVIRVEIPVRLKGIPEGVRVSGGMLEHIAHKLTVECIPSAIPEHIDIDITHLGVNKSIHVSDLNIEGVKFSASGDTVVAIVHAKRGGDETDAAPAKK